MESPLKEILKNITNVPKYGNPGSLIVFEPNAYPILSISENETSSIIFAAAEIGQGRIFVTSSDKYIENFFKNSPDSALLWTNIKLWLTRGKFVKNEEIPNISIFDSVSDINVQLVKWIGTDTHKSELFLTQLLKKYLMSGGSLICGMCPRTWINMSYGKCLEECSLNKLISSCGICFSSFFCKIQTNYFSIEKNIAETSHLGDAIDLLSTSMNEILNLKHLIINGIMGLPCSISTKHLEKLHKILNNFIGSNNRPTIKDGVDCEIGRSLLSVACQVYQKFSSCGIRVKAPYIEEFPGNFSELEKPEATCAVITIKSKFDEFHSTGYYIAGGELVKIAVLEGNPNGWEVRVGCHTDELSTEKTMHRWPLVTTSVKLKKSFNLSSAFGGLIYLESPKGNSTIKIKFENVIEAPYYDVKKPDTVLQWHERRKSPGLWADLCGRHVIFTVPSSSIRNLENPEEALKIWDFIVMANHELRGTDPFNTWRERIVIDIQPRGGFCHSGYPITLSYDHVKNQSVWSESDIFLFNPNEILNKGWILIHELGHNFVRSCWTPEGTEEITVNLFTLHGYHLILKEKPWINRYLKHGLDEKILDVLTLDTYCFKDWCSNSRIGLFLYAQLFNSFGWNSYKTLFREYESLNEKEKSYKTELDKWDQFICRFSNIVGLDISPLFYFWAIPFSEKVINDLRNLTPWLPDDEVTRLYGDRVKYVKIKYKNLLLGNEMLYSSCPLTNELNEISE